MGYILLLLICVYLPLTSKTGWCWNLLESSPARIPLIELSHKWTWILFIIINSKLGIWVFGQPIINANSQSNLYDVLTLEHTRIFPTQSTNYILVIHFTSISFMLWPFHTSIKQLYFLLRTSLKRAHSQENTRTKLRIYKISVPELPSNTSKFTKEDIYFN